MTLLGCDHWSHHWINRNACLSRLVFKIFGHSLWVAYRECNSIDDNIALRTLIVNNKSIIRNISAKHLFRPFITENRAATKDYFHYWLICPSFLWLAQTSPRWRPQMYIWVAGIWKLGLFFWQWLIKIAADYFNNLIVDN